MEIALIDDEKYFNERFQNEMKEFNLSCKYFDDYNSFIRAGINGYEADILLLDIDMPDINGFEIAKQLETSKPNMSIIFVTSHKELVYDAFACNVVGFFPKDTLFLDKEKFIKKLHEVYKRNSFILIKSENGIKRVYTKNIQYIEMVGRTVIVYTADKEILRTTVATLKEIHDALDSSCFIYVNRSVIINTQHVYSVDKSHIRLVNVNRIFKISRGKEGTVKQSLHLI